MQQRECIAKKEGRLFKENAQNASTELPLEVGQNVYHQDPHTQRWHSGVIENTCKEPHSFLVRSSNGAVYRRNRNFLKSRQTEGFVQSSQNPAVKPFQPQEQQCPSNTMGNTVPQASQVQAAVQDTPPLYAAKTPNLIHKTPARSSPAGLQKSIHQDHKRMCTQKTLLWEVKECTRTCKDNVHSV